MKTWFTSDTHLGHYNIITYCNRPFDTLEQMDETIIRNWNSRVSPTDTVYFLGDFCFRNTNLRGEGIRTQASTWRKKLNGDIVFIKGNHDKNNCNFSMLSSAILYFGGKTISLTHRLEDANLSCDLCFVGHVHDNWAFQKKERGFIANVGVDVNNFKPVSYDEIVAKYQKICRDSSIGRATAL